MKDYGIYKILEENSEENGLIVIPSEDLLKLPPDEAIAELEAYILFLKNDTENNMLGDSRLNGKIDKSIQLEFKLKVAENFLSHYKQGSTPQFLKYLDFKKDKIDWLSLGPEILGEKQFDEIINQTFSDSNGQKQFDDAEKVNIYPESILHINPHDAQAHYNRGLTYAKRGENLEAIRAFRQAIKIDPNYTDAHYSLGLTYGHLGSYDEEIDAYIRTISIEPNYSLAHYNLGVVYMELGRFQEAAEAFIQAIRIEPNNSVAYDNLGSAYIELGSYQEAIFAINTAIKIDPNLVLAHFNLGRIYVILAQYDKAIELLKKLTFIDPNNIAARSLLGLSYSLIGDRDAAFEEYEVLKVLDENLANRLLKAIRKDQSI